MKKYVVLLIWVLMTPATGQASWADSVLKGGLHLIPDSTLISLFHKASPADAIRLQSKVDGLYRQCSGLVKKTYRAVRQQRTLRQTRGLGKRRVKAAEGELVLTGKQLALVKNDHVNALKRVGELQSYLGRVSIEIHNYVNWWIGFQSANKNITHRQFMETQKAKGLPFIQVTYKHLKAIGFVTDSTYHFLMRNLMNFIDRDLQRDLILLKQSISNREYKLCRINMKRFANE